MRMFLVILVLFLANAAQAADSPLGGGNNNSKQPIQVDADTLEVFQDQQKAIFTGNVIAKQGTMTVKSDRMTIYYTGKQDAAAATPKPKATAGDKSSSGSSIKRIDVDGNVYLTSPGQAARSAKGYYDTQKNFISLSDNVVLTKDNNILKGNKLDYFVDTGYSKVYSEAGTNPTGARVRGLFVPDQGDGK